jgi:hypothetical protein
VVVKVGIFTRNLLDFGFFIWSNFGDCVERMVSRNTTDEESVSSGGGSRRLSPGLVRPPGKVGRKRRCESGEANGGKTIANGNGGSDGKQPRKSSRLSQRLTLTTSTPTSLKASPIL